MMKKMMMGMSYDRKNEQGQGKCRRLLFSMLVAAMVLGGFQGVAQAAPAEVVKITNLVAGPGQTDLKRVAVEKGRMVTVTAVSNGRCSFMIRDKAGKTLRGSNPLRFYSGKYKMTDRQSFYPVQTDELQLMLVGWDKIQANAEVTVEYDRGFQLEPAALNGQMWTRLTRMPAAAWMSENGARIHGSRNEFKINCEFVQGEGLKTLTLQPGGVRDLGFDGGGVYGIAIMPNYFQPFPVVFDGALTFDGMRLERSASYQFYVKEPGKTPEFINEPVVNLFDGDGDGLAEALVLELRVKIGLNKEATAHARLVDQSGYIIHPDVIGEVRNPVGFEDVPVRLFVRAEQLVRTGRPGPWSFTDIRLWDSKTDQMLDRAEDLMTQTYSMGTFKSPEPPVIESISVNEQQVVTIKGKNVGDARKVMIDGYTCQHIVQGLNQIQVIPAKNATTPEEWKQVCQNIQSVKVTVSSDWGTGKRP
ncbi:MAG: IPT/TIG domain-containing protein [Phycisphaerae bacterium]